MIDFARKQRRDWLYSFRRSDSIRQAIGITVVGVLWALILFIGIGGEL